MNLPPIIQGGMGVAVSRWPLARAVSRAGQIGVVSGTALDCVIARNLQQGDLGGHVRRALAHFPVKEMACRVYERYFVEGGKKEDEPYKAVPVHLVDSPKAAVELTIVANFVEVFLAKEGHNGLIGINYLEKIQLPTLPSLMGAMAAGVHFVMMGAGIPRAIPGIMDQMALGMAVELPLDVEGSGKQPFSMRFDPADWFGKGVEFTRPRFIAIVSSSSLATSLARKATGKVDGFIVEGAKAGGHNAPPRGAMQLDDTGQPVYGDRDQPDLEQIRNLGLPFYMAGQHGTPQKLKQALDLGATGVQVGTAFAFCEESGMRADLRKSAIQASRNGKLDVFTDPLVSPTGFPFKVLQLEGTLSEPGVYEGRERLCDLGLLRHCYLREDGTIGYRCPAEPIDDFLAKGGNLASTRGRACICNGLAATAGFAQVRKSGYREPAIITAGDDAVNIADYLQEGKQTYTAADVIRHILG